METIYPLDKIYSNAVGVTYPVCGAKSSETPVPEMGDTMNVYVSETEQTGEGWLNNGSVWYYAEVQCTGQMPGKNYVMNDSFHFFTFYMTPKSTDESVLIINTHNDGNYVGDVEVGDEGTIRTPIEVFDAQGQEMDPINTTVSYTFSEYTVI